MALLIVAFLPAELILPVVIITIIISLLLVILLTGYFCETGKVAKFTK